MSLINLVLFTSALSYLLKYGKIVYHNKSFVALYLIFSPYFNLKSYSILFYKYVI